MSESTPTITRYLLGELSEKERSALEERYFADPRVFEEVAAAETALVDDYVRGQLPADLRRRFERAYLADPRRRHRVRFAEALAARADQAGSKAAGESPWASWLSVLWPSTPRLGFAVATVLLASTGLWVAMQREGHRGAATTPEADPAEPGRKGAPPPAPTGPSRPPAGPSPQGLPAPSFATLDLALGGDRSPEAGPPPVLVVPPGTPSVRLRLRLPESEHSRYQVVVRAIGGEEILRRSDLRPAAEGSGALLTLIVPARRFSAGDYVLTLQGAGDGSEIEDLSQSLFRVEQ